jgi:hypothetical protein
MLCKHIQIVTHVTVSQTCPDPFQGQAGGLAFARTLHRPNELGGARNKLGVGLLKIAASRRFQTGIARYFTNLLAMLKRLAASLRLISINAATIWQWLFVEKDRRIEHDTQARPARTGP